MEAELRAGAAEVGGAVAEAESFRLRTSELEQERRMLEDRLENAKAVAENAKRKGKEEEAKVIVQCPCFFPLCVSREYTYIFRRNVSM